MIAIYNKTFEELINEEISFGLLTANTEGLCPTYVLTEEGEMIDTCDLREEYVINAFNEDLDDFKDKFGTYKKGRHVRDNLPNKENLVNTSKNHPDSFSLAYILSDRKFSYQAIESLILLRKKHGRTAAHIIQALQQPNEVISAAEKIVGLFKEIQGDFTPIQANHLIAAVRQIQNEDYRTSTTQTSFRKK